MAERPAPDDARTRRLRRRRRAERRFRAAGLGAVAVAGLILVALLAAIAVRGVPGFARSELAVTLDFAARPLEPGAPLPARVAAAAAPAGDALADDAWRLVAARLASEPALAHARFTIALPVSDALAAADRGDGPAALQRLAHHLRAEGRLSSRFDPGFFTRSDAVAAQQVGIHGALVGSLLTMLITLGLAFPLGVAAAIWLEEFARPGRWRALIEISINNLAAVPSIIFGLLGVALLLTVLPGWRSAPLIGGITLALMAMPVIVIAARTALRAVPPSLRQAALGLGASQVQTVFHHVLPAALPGILTGTIIGMARAAGETAPLLLIGMRAFVASPPAGLAAPATVLPVQVFLWSDQPGPLYSARTAAAILVLLVFLLGFNALAIALRARAERRG